MVTLRVVLAVGVLVVPVVVIASTASAVLVRTLALFGRGVLIQWLVFHGFERLVVGRTIIFLLFTRGTASSCAYWSLLLGRRVGFVWEVALFALHGYKVTNAWLISTKVFTPVGKNLLDWRCYIVGVLFQRSSAGDQFVGSQF